MRVVVGRIGRPHGIRGEVTVEPRTDEPDERFAPGAVLFANTPAGRLEVTRAHWHSGRLLVSFEGVSDRNGAEALRGVILEIDRDDAEAPDDPEEFYDSALVGCTVVTGAGVAVGEITEVAPLPGQDLLVVVGPVGEVLVPFVEEIVPVVEPAERRVVIDPPPGLIEEPTD
jgi:16S rRNA processing protein RimM